MKFSLSERESLSAMLQHGAEQALGRLNKIRAGEWKLETLDWEVPLEAVFQSWPRGDAQAQKFYGAYFPMPGAAVMAVFPLLTAASLIEAYTNAAGSAQRMIMESEALGEIANVIVNGIGGVLADAGRFSFFLPSPEVFLSHKPDLLEKVRHAVIQLQGPGQEPALMTRILLQSGDLECLLVVLLGVSWRDYIQPAEKSARR